MQSQVPDGQRATPESPQGQPRRRSCGSPQHRQLHAEVRGPPRDAGQVGGAEEKPLCPRCLSCPGLFPGGGAWKQDALTLGTFYASLWLSLKPNSSGFSEQGRSIKSVPGGMKIEGEDWGIDHLTL